MNTSPTSEERIWAVLSHLSSLAFGMGSLLPIIGWSEQRRKSKYATFQCLQALGYQSLGYTVWFLSYLLILILFFVVFTIALSATFIPRGREDAIFGVWMAAFLVLMFGSLALYFLLPVIAAIACALGKDFRYPIMGNRLAKYLGYRQANDSEWLIEEHEDRWVASMGNFAIIIFLWGVLAPVTAWMVQGKRSLFLKFQSIQTVILHAIVDIIYFAAVFIFMIGFLAFMVTAGIVGPERNVPMPGIGVFLVFSLLGSVLFLVIPLFHILGQWAGYRLLKGDDYKYPIIGKLVEKQMARKPQVTLENNVSAKGETQ